MRDELDFNELIGATGTIRDACERAKLAADSGVAVFLWGEPGVGKETLARAIAAAREPSRRFLPLDGGAIPWRRWESLIATSGDELVVFIDGAERIPRQVGRNFANAILSGRVKFQTIFSATVASGFCPELTALFGAFPIFLPPLRERPQDFAAFATRFFADATEEARILRDPLSPDELERLRALDFPDNLDGLRRALKFVVERDALPQTTAELDSYRSSGAESRPSVSPPDAARARAPEEDDGAEGESSTFLTLDQAMKAHIERALRRSHGFVDGKNGAAKELAINPHTLRARMIKLGIDWNAFRDDDPDAASEPDAP